MRRFTPPLTPILYLLILIVAACSSDETPTEPAPSASVADMSKEALRERFGIVLWDAAFYDVDDGTELVFAGEVNISLPGLGHHRMYMEESVFSAADGGGIMEYVEDLDTGDVRRFFYYPNDNQVLFSQDVTSPDSEFLELRGTTVELQPDGTYFVIGFDDTQPDNQGDIEEGADGFEAVRLVEKYADFSGMTPHMLMFAIALGQSPTPEARAIGTCIAPNCPEGCEEGNPNLAERPSFCSIFQEFCDCAACTVNPQGEACPRCPKLAQ